MKKIFNTLAITALISGAPAAITNPLTLEKTETSNNSIRCSINYRSNWHLTASWSGTARKKEEKEYKLFNLLNYATNPLDFFGTYPTVTLATSGHARSSSTFGDVGQNKFGDKTFLTSDFFKGEDIKYRYLVDAYDTKVAAYTVSVNIGVGFQTKDNVLSLFPTIYGRLTSVGAYNRVLDFGFELYSITFNSRNTNN